jgi:hypothetical protein
MWRQPYRDFLRGAVALAIFTGCALASHHHDLNGSWQLIPARSEFHGESVIQSGTVTIDDRQGNIYVSRNFIYDGANQSTTSTFSTDAREKTSIKEPGFKSKTQWKGDVLEVTTTRDGATTVERYSLRDAGTMVLMIDRPGHALETLLFQRQ